jgi:uncharacterized protein
MGRGVYTRVSIRRGAIVEVAPVIPLTGKDWKQIKDSSLETYVFAWGANEKSNALALGFGGLFNHSDDPNLLFALNLEERSITFRARRDIAASEQLTIDYRWSEKDKKKYLFLPAQR